MGRVARAIIANGGILAQSYADSRELRKTRQHIFSVKEGQVPFPRFLPCGAEQGCYSRGGTGLGNSKGLGRSPGGIHGGESQDVGL